MQRPQRHLDTEGEGECQEQPEGSLFNRHVSVCHQSQNSDVVKGVVDVVKRDDADQHQQTTDGRIYEEFYCRVNSSLATPNANQEKHRHQRRLEEQIEEEQIQRYKHAHHCASQQHQKDVVGKLSLLD